MSSRNNRGRSVESVEDGAALFADSSTPASTHTSTPASTLALADQWEAVNQAFAQTVQTVATCDYFCAIGDRVVRLCFAGEALAARLTPALAHLAVPPHPTPALTIRLWDSVTTGVALPPLPTAMLQPPSETARWGSHAHSERFHAFFQPLYQLFTMLDRQSNQAIYWVQGADCIPLTEGAAPLITLLHWWLGQQSRQVVHGAAIGTAAGGLLLVGKSGSGKSTTALACLNAGLQYLGDDYCLVAATPQPTAYSLYSSGKVHFADLARFPRLQAAQSTNRYIDADKALYFFAKPFADQIVPSLPLKALLLPTIRAGSKSALHAVTPAKAFLAMGPSTLFQLIGERPQTMRHLSELARQLPCYRLTLGADMEQVPLLIANLLTYLSESD